MQEESEGIIYIHKTKGNKIRFISYWNEWAVYYRDLNVSCNCLMAKDKFFPNYEKEDNR